MKKRKVYIFLVGTSGYGYWSIGGAEMYIAGKAKYLEARGWQVFMCTPCKYKGKCAISSLEKYLEVGAGWNFLSALPYKLKKYEQEQILSFMVSRLKLKDYNKCEIIIETTWDFLGYWGELLAEKVKGRHFNVLLNEFFNESYYKDNLDFFYFKWKRNELVGSPSALTRLFEGYKNVTKPLYDMPDTVREQEAIQDIAVNNFDEVLKLDWNICYIGRTIKPYVPAMIIGVGELARRYPDKKINFMIIGNADCRIPLLKEVFEGISNVKLTLFGDMVPIPRILFSKIDVVMAGAQSALFAANEGVLTIAADVDDEGTSGVLGYDTKDAWFGGNNDGAREKHISYLEALENVLVKRLYDNRKYDMPKLLPSDHYYDKFWIIVKNAAETKEYYSEKLSEERIRNWVAIFPFGIVPKGIKIIIYGATEIRKDYIKQVEGQKYCQILTTVDEHSEEYDNSVLSLDRLKTVDYDCIVIATFQQEAQAAYEKIMSIVPQMQGRVIYDFKCIII